MTVRSETLRRDAPVPCPACGFRCRTLLAGDGCIQCARLGHAGLDLVAGDDGAGTADEEAEVPANVRRAGAVGRPSGAHDSGPRKLNRAHHGKTGRIG